MTLADQLASFLALCRRKGVEIVPEWLRPLPQSLGKGWRDTRSKDDVADDAAALIAAGAISGWLAERWVTVRYNKSTLGWEKWWQPVGPYGAFIWSPMPDTTDHLTALIAAATTILEAMPDVKGGTTSHDAQ